MTNDNDTDPRVLIIEDYFAHVKGASMHRLSTTVALLEAILPLFFKRKRKHICEGLGTTRIMHAVNTRSKIANEANLGDPVKIPLVCQHAVGIALLQMGFHGVLQRGCRGHIQTMAFNVSGADFERLRASVSKSFDLNGVA